MVMWHVEKYILPRDEESSTPEGWTRGNTKNGPVLEVVTNYHQGKPGVEIGIESLSNDGSQSWIRISNGLSKFVRYLTEKIRIHEDNEDTLASTVRPVTHDSKIVETYRVGMTAHNCRTSPLPTVHSPLVFSTRHRLARTDHSSITHVVAQGLKKLSASSDRRETG